MPSLIKVIYNMPIVIESEEPQLFNENCREGTHNVCRNMKVEKECAKVLSNSFRPAHMACEHTVHAHANCKIEYFLR